MTERSPECWVCEAILLDWVVLGIRALEVLRGAVLKHCEHCPHTNDTDLGTLWRFNTWNLAASSSSRQLVLSVQGPATLSICNAEARYPMRIASAMLSSNWEKQNAPFMFIMSVLSPTLGTRPQCFGGTNMENQFRGRTTSCCFRLASASSRSILVTHQSHQKYANRKFLQLISSVVVDPIGRPPQTAGASTDSHPQP